MRVCSFVPAATDIIYRLGMEDHLLGVTSECRSDKPKIVRTSLEHGGLGSRGIDEAVRRSRNIGEDLYWIDRQRLAAMNPDLIFVQDVCEVCQVGPEQVMEALADTGHAPRVVQLHPRNLEDVLDSVVSIAQALGVEERGHQLVLSLQERIHTIHNVLRDREAPRRRAALIEWLEPLFAGGHWVPEQVALAGGIDLLSEGIERSVGVPWEKLRLANPDVLVVAPCGFDIGKTKTEATLLRKLPGWDDLAAVRNSKVFLADSRLFTQPGTTLVDGIELLASLFHPGLFPLGSHLTGSVTALQRARTCPQCGTEFLCGPAHPSAQCWCSELPHVIALRPGATCLCPKCLEKAIQAKLSGGAP